ncbi:hypothetical protein GQ53DRAFT_48202 [Thozetella sp. PMI_491]|nr:hypothetical protein GQ53DRAFT_48202 [Thozetella sp. PMI_491]
MECWMGPGNRSQVPRPIPLRGQILLSCQHIPYSRGTPTHSIAAYNSTVVQHHVLLLANLQEANRLR